MSETVPAGWYPDPSGRHQLRYWNGTAWTDHAADEGVQVLDPLVAVAPPTKPLSRREARQSQKEERAERARLEKARAERETQERIAREREEQIRAQRDAQEREAQRLQQLAIRKEAAAQKLREEAEREARMFALPLFFLPAYNSYPSTEVAGEFARIDAIHKALGRTPRRDEELVQDDAIAVLAPEPSNKFDANAVRVFIKGQHVGYLEREVAATVQPSLLRIVDAGYMPAVGARIWATAREDYSDRRKVRHHANVRVALNYAHMLLPVNDPPRELYSVLPWGGSLQVTGEEQHQEVLSNYTAPDQESLVVATLAVIQASRPNAKDIVEIRVDGERIGQLTPGSSQHFLPTIRHLDDQGMTTAAWVAIKGNAIAAQATIHATRAHELPSDWFGQRHEVPRLHGAVALDEDAALDDDEIRRQMRPPMWGEP